MSVKRRENVRLAACSRVKRGKILSAQDVESIMKSNALESSLLMHFSSFYAVIEKGGIEIRVEIYVSSSKINILI